MAKSLSSELSIAVLDELGIDIDYVRHKGGASARLYFTGVEWGILVSTGALASVLLGFAKGLAEGFGKEAGKAVAEAVVNRLKGIRDKVVGATPADKKEALTQARSFQQQIDDVIANDLPQLLSGRAAGDALGASFEYEASEVKSYLVKSGMTDDLASVHAENVVRVIIKRWSSG